MIRIEEEQSVFCLFGKKKTNFGFEGHTHNDNGERGAYYGGGFEEGYPMGDIHDYKADHWNRFAAVEAL